MRAMLMGLAFWLCAQLAYAGKVTVTWSAPVKCATETRMTDCIPIKYTVYASVNGHPKSVLGAVQAPTGVYMTDNLAPGLWCFAITATSSAGESEPTADACVSVQGSTPGPPQNQQAVLTVSNPAHP